jgi:hypothetical protein
MEWAAQIATIETVLAAHRDSYRDAVDRWKQIETKVATYLVLVGIVIAALAVLIQVNPPRPSIFLSVLSLVAGLIATIYCLLCLRAQDTHAAPLAMRTNQIVFDQLKSDFSEESFGNFLSDLSREWNSVVDGLREDLRKKARNAQIALNFLVASSSAAMFALLAKLACLAVAT